MRCDKASSRVTWNVEYSSGSTKSSLMIDEIWVCHVNGVLELAVSSMSSETAAAVKDLVVEPG